MVRFFCSLLLTLTIFSCLGNPFDFSEITAEVSFDDSKLAGTALMVATLWEESAYADASASRVAITEVEVDSSPQTFVIDYKASKVASARDYYVTIKIYNDSSSQERNNLLFFYDGFLQVITGDNPKHLDVELTYAR